MVLSAAIRTIAVTATGLAAGVLLGHWRGVSNAVPRLDPSSFVQLQQTIHVHFVPMMPILLSCAAIGALAWAYSMRRRRGTAVLRLVMASAVGMVAVLVMTWAVNVPINRQLMTWSVDAPPADLAVIWARWEMSHRIRTAIAVVAFVFQAAALAAGAVGPRRAPA